MHTQNPMPHGTFVVYGDNEPIVISLTATGLYWFRETERIVARWDRPASAAVAETFGDGFAYALPAWSRDCMERIAREYEGPHKLRLRAVCAAIALGMPLADLPQTDAAPAQKKSGKRDSNGTARLVPPQPTLPPLPAAAA